MHATVCGRFIKAIRRDLCGQKWKQESFPGIAHIPKEVESHHRRTPEIPVFPFPFPYYSTNLGIARLPKIIFRSGCRLYPREFIRYLLNRFALHNSYRLHRDKNFYTYYCCFFPPLFSSFRTHAAASALLLELQSLIKYF